MLTPTAFRLVFVFLLSFCSYAFLKDVSGIPSTWMPNDKLMHALVFCGLMLCWQAGFGRILLGFIALVIYGGAVELAQHYFTNRMGDWWDWLADISGLLIAILCWHWRLQNWVYQWQRR